jgi:hypothetical protein
MGCRSSVEIMHLVTKVLVGHPSVCQRRFVIASLDVYIDDFRAVGSPEHIENIINRINERSVQLNVTLKAPLRAVTEYTFLGFNFDHQRRTVTVAAKTLQKLPEPDAVTSSISAMALQQLVARLIFCSGGLRIPLAEYYLVIKWASRSAHNLNVGLLSPDSIVAIPSTMLAMLRIWLRQIRIPYVATPRPNNQHSVCYVDASISGWGAIIFLPDGRVFISGAAWPQRQQPYTSRDINMLEARALRMAVRDFGDFIRSTRNVEFKIDNTAVKSAIPRGVARSEALNNELRPVFNDLRRHGIFATASYVESVANLADPLSRGRPALPVTRDMANKILYERRGGAGIW